MDNLNEYKSNITDNIDKIIDKVDTLIRKYNKFFNIEEIFSSENGGKTRLNRQVFNDNHDLISAIISEINFCLDEILTILKNQIRMTLSKYNQYEKSELENFVFDDKNFLEILELDLDTHGITGETKFKCLKDMQEFLNLKNKIYNFKYFVDMFDTSIFDKYINKLGIEDLINSTIIFEIIDSYALQFEELKKLSIEIKNINSQNEKIINFTSTNSLLELHKRRADNYNYAGVRYKILIEYFCDISLNRPVNLNIAYLENILSCFIEQSCMDVIKKELKKGKLQKQIDVNITLNRGIFQMIVKNNGFEVRNVYNLFLSDIDNKYILEAKNLANFLNAKLDITALDNEGMQYILTLNLKK